MQPVFPGPSLADSSGPSRTGTVLRPGQDGFRRIAKRAAVMFALAWATVVQADDMQIGVLAFRGHDAALARWSATAEYLTRRITEHRFVIVPLDLERMSEEVASGSLDFVLTNTGNYVVLESEFGVSRLATLKVHHQGRDYTRFGAAIFTRSDHPEIREIRDLAGHSFMAVSREAFGGFQMAWQEMLEHGIDPFRDLGSLEFVGFPQDAIVRAVLAGEADAGTVRARTLHRMADEGLVDPGKIRVLGQRRDAAFPFPLSTRLYPEWPFAKTRDTPDHLAQEVAVALLGMPADSEAARKADARWTIPLDYGSVHALFRQLEIGPYRDLAKPGLDKVWREYKVWIILGAAALAAALLVSLLVGRANRRIKLSESMLRREVDQRRRTEILLQAHRDSLERRVSRRTAALAEANESLRRSEATLRRLHGIFAATRDPLETQFEKLISEGCRYFRLANGCLAPVDPDAPDPTLEPLGSNGQQTAASSRSLQAWALSRLGKGQGVVALADVQGTDHETARGALLAAPVTREGRMTAGLVFSDPMPREREFSDVDVDILLLMAGWVGSALEKREISRLAEEHQLQLAHVTRLNSMGEMAAGIAHELNQPLTAIINYANGCARLIRRGPGAAEELEHAIGLIGNDAHRAAEIIRRLRDFLRHGDLRSETFPLSGCVGNALEMLGGRLRQLGVKVTRHEDLADDRVHADHIQVEQVIINLLLNAMDALADRPLNDRRIDIRLTDAGAEIRLSVADNGGGISEGEFEQVLHPFFTTKPGGMGMGLSISRSIVEAHGGALRIGRPDEGGTEVSFTLPTRPEASRAVGT